VLKDGAMRTQDWALVFDELIYSIVPHLRSLTNVNALARSCKRLLRSTRDVKVFEEMLKHWPPILVDAAKDTFVLPRALRVVPDETMRGRFGAKNHFKTLRWISPLQGFRMGLGKHKTLTGMGKARVTREQRSLSMQRVWVAKRKRNADLYERRLQTVRMLKGIAGIPADEQAWHLQSFAESDFLRRGVIHLPPQAMMLKVLAMIDCGAYKDDEFVRITRKIFVNEKEGVLETRTGGVLNLYKLAEEERLQVLRWSLEYNFYLNHYTNFLALRRTYPTLDSAIIQSIVPLFQPYPWKQLVVEKITEVKTYTMHALITRYPRWVADHHDAACRVWGVAQ
jgi:hypothetical protein